MEAGYTPESKVMDKPLTVQGHDVHNDDHRYRGLITFQKALGISDNVAATRILMRLGIGNVVEKAHQFGITSTLHPVPSLALGTSEITVLENTSAFGVFATGGLRAEPTPVERVDNSAGETLVQHAHPVQAARVISEPSAAEMQQMLRYVVTSGTGQNADISGLDVIGKTGTTSDNKDVWFMGSTKQLVCGIWMGYDLPSELHGSSGGGWCAPAWRAFMEKASDIWGKRDPVQKLVESARATQLRRVQADQNRHSSNDTRRRPRSIDDNSGNNDSTPSGNQSPPSRSDREDQPPPPPAAPQENSPAPPPPNPSAPVRRYYNNGDSGDISSSDSSPIPNQQ
jgi:penicillin-binding protein 1A